MNRYNRHINTGLDEPKVEAEDAERLSIYIQTCYYFYRSIGLRGRARCVAPRASADVASAA